MRSEDRKAATAAYKERKSATGIFAVRCIPTGQRWVGRAPNLDSIQNRMTFTLARGSSLHPALQAAWNEHGAENFAFEEIERLDEETFSYGRDRTLKERLAYWSSTLGAKAL